MKKIMIFGSCRVLTVLEYLEKKQLISIHNENIFGITHTAGEVLQVIKHCKNNFQYNKNFLKFITNSPKGIVYDSNNELEEIDTFVIELCSLKSIQYENMYFRINLIADFILDQKLTFLNEFWKDLNKGKEKVNRSEYLINNDSIVDSLTRNIVEYLTIEMQTEKVFKNHMLMILSQLPKNKKIIFISHFDIKVENKDIRIPSRVKLAKWMNEFCSDHDPVEFYNPRFLLEEYGLNKGLKDASHYTEDFKIVLADDIYETVLQ